MIFSGFGLVLLACGSALASRTGEILDAPMSGQSHAQVATASTGAELDDSWILSRSDKPGSSQEPVKTDKNDGEADYVPTGHKRESTAVLPADAKPAQVPASVPSIPLSEGVATSLSFVNNVRAEVGKSALKLDTVLNSYALNHAKNLASQCKLFHQNISLMLGKKDATGKSITAIAENVAYSSSSLSQALDVLKNSEGHYKNMIGNYTRVGFGIVKSGAASCKGHIYTVQVFAKS